MSCFDMEFYKDKRVFVTGHSGFKGAWLCKLLMMAGAKVTGFSLGPPTNPSLFELAHLAEGMTSVIGDIRDLSAMQKAFHASHPEIVFHLAAQPIVRESYNDPVGTYATNVMGTVNLLECVRESVISGGVSPLRSVVIITTDKIYLNREWAWGYREDEMLDGFDPYSNSKSCAELAVHSYCNSFFADREVAVSTARAGNVIGGGDFAPDRIIPDCVRAVQSGKPLQIRNPYSTRPYQHVLEPLAAYLMIGQHQWKNKAVAGWYNVGPDDCDFVTTGQLVELFAKQWGSGFSWENKSEANAPHEANFLKLDSTKLKTTFGWMPRWHTEEAIARTVDWTKVWFRGEDVSSEMEQEIQWFMEK